ncbi:MAG: hypothetical protein IPG51_19620 [Chloroflexi bacterium]|nr:hypothetical protein [Chloroflexota bacterium]
MANEPLQYGRLYHIYNRGNNGENIFVQQRNYPYFLQLYANHIQPVAETYAYCLLPNHFHFAIRTYTEEEQICLFSKNRQISTENRQIFKPTPPSQAFKNLFIAYTRAFNQATGRTGTLFERPFHRKPVDSQHYLLTLIFYIHHNPQKHGFVTDFRDWPWSSYGAILSSKPTKLNRADVLDWYNGRAPFIAAHEAEPEHELAASLLMEDWW